ncbi:NADP-dependent oxidoreductase [Devosia sp.]|uniref:NADP-dependent oxidoreductase n=1 Tax=Devosia sp. TaxID=1871048 RepID=UPI001AC5B686|nr:NADP-dependent oxidoreductase [Devosia sp.]MBN9336037.1 NADP-dependent oxidoreductase [Devosia sp.]
MRAAYITGYGDNSVVGYGPEALIDVRAASVNPVELAFRAGEFQASVPFAFPKVMGFDVAGVVISAPEGAAFKTGDEVYARLPSRQLGAFAERAVVPVDLLAFKPRTLSFEAAASLPTVALTTWQAFIERAQLAQDERVLIQAGAGGVGAFAIQLAKHLGAHVVATGGPGSQARMAELGADQTVDYTHQRFEDFGPFDIVYDGVCGPLIERGIDALREGGRYIGLVRVADARSYREAGLPAAIAEQAAAPIQPLIERATARGAFFHGPLTRPDGAQLAAIAQVIDDGAIRATVSKTYRFEQLAAAYDDLATGHTSGKIVLVP